MGLNWDDLGDVVKIWSMACANGETVLASSIYHQEVTSREGMDS